MCGSHHIFTPDELAAVLSGSDLCLSPAESHLCVFFLPSDVPSNADWDRGL